MLKYNPISNSMFRVSPDMIDDFKKQPLLSPFFIISVGIMDGNHTKGKRVDRFFDSEFLMLYCIDGKGWTQTPGGKIYEITVGNVFFCFEKTVQKYWADKDTPWTIAWARFNGTQAYKLLKNLNISFENPVITIGFNEKVLSLHKEMTLIMERGFAYNHILHAANCLRSLFSYFSICKTNYTDEPAISRIIDYMNSNINKSLHLQHISEKLNITNDYLIRYFKKQTGYTPMDYFINLKIQKACYLITTTDKAICDISAELGFNNPYYFSRIFKNKTGYSPSEYRKTYSYM